MKRKIMVPLAMVGAMVCAMAAVKTDYDHKANFERYHTYSWLRASASNDLWTDRITQAVDAQLAAKGWSKVASGGDAAVSAFGRVRNEQTYQTYYDGIGAGWFWGGFGETATTTVENVPVGSLSVDIFDGSTKHLIWRGTADSTLSEKPDKNERKLEHNVEDMFKHFPR